MKAVQCSRFAALDSHGKPTQPAPLESVLDMVEIPRPQPAAHEVLIEVQYAGVQYPDFLQVQGLYQVRPELPFTPGVDVTGTVSQVGAEVKHVAPGDSVVAYVPVGGLAEYCCANGTNVWKAPAGVALETCANIGRNYFAAFHSLQTIGQTGKGTLVLVDGASGGVGQASIQLAKAMGATVIAATSTHEKMQIAMAAGADVGLVYGREKSDYVKFKSDVRAACKQLGKPAGVDLVIDMVQGELFETALLSCIRPLGTICLVGFTGGQIPIRPGLILIKQAAVVGSLWAPWADQQPQEHQQNVSQILGFLEDGSVAPRVDRTFEMAEYLAAFRLFEQNQGRGNTVVKIRG